MDHHFHAVKESPILPPYMQNLRNLREDHDYSQEYVAHVLGTSQTMYARYERGANELPLRHFIKLCKLYDVSADDVLELKENYKEQYKHKNSR